MDFALTDNQESIRATVAKICERFDDAYWLKRDKEGGFPADFHRAFADAGWLGICMPEEVGPPSGASTPKRSTSPAPRATIPTSSKRRAPS